MVKEIRIRMVIAFGEERSLQEARVLPAIFSLNWGLGSQVFMLSLCLITCIHYNYLCVLYLPDFSLNEIIGFSSIKIRKLKICC